MTTKTVTFDFATDAELFMASPDSIYSVMMWAGGALSTTTSHPSLDDRNQWKRDLTFEDMGIPAGSTIIGISGASMQSKCTKFYHGLPSYAGEVDLINSNTNTFALLAYSREFSAIDADYVTTSGVDISTLNWASSDPLTIAIHNRMTTDKQPHAEVALLQTNLSFTVTYSP